MGNRYFFIGELSGRSSCGADPQQWKTVRDSRLLRPPRRTSYLWIARRMPTASLRAVKQTIVTLDMEGVLTPEIWIAVAERTGLPELRRTTRDEPDYDKLMRYRL